MQKTKPDLLFTAPLNPQKRNLLQQAGINFEVQPCFVIRYLLNLPEITQQIQNALHPALPNVMVLTSKRAAKIIAKLPAEIWGNFKYAYAVGDTTAQPLQQLKIQVKTPPSPNGATELATYITQNIAPANVIFATTKQHRPELPNILTQNGFIINTVYVYETVSQTIAPVAETIKKIVIMSPSAAKGFFARNRHRTDLQIIAAGTTTAQAITQITGTPPAVVTKPGFDNVYKTIKQLNNA